MKINIFNKKLHYFVRNRFYEICDFTSHLLIITYDIFWHEIVTLWSHNCRFNKNLHSFAINNHKKFPILWQSCNFILKIYNFVEVNIYYKLLHHYIKKTWFYENCDFLGKYCFPSFILFYSILNKCYLTKCFRFGLSTCTALLM